MIDEKEIMPFNFFTYGGVYSGDHHGMRYKIERVGEKPDFALSVQVWQGPFASVAVTDDKKIIQTFDYSETGRKEAIKWLLQMYEERKEEWDRAPMIVDAPIEVK